jgi:TolB protein
VRSLPVLVVLALTALAASGGAPPQAAGPSPNGLIVFSSNRDGDYELFTIRADGRGLRRLTRNKVSDSCPSWSPNGRWIAFSRNRGRKQPWGQDLFVMRGDGTKVRRVLRSTGYDTCPDWSPDGRRLVFSRLSADAPTDDIFSVRLDGRGLRRLTDNGRSRSPAWSTGNRIVWQFRFSTIVFDDIFVMNPDGSDQRMLTNSGDNAEPAWSPDGRRIVYSGIDQNDVLDHELWVMNADGTENTKLTERDRFIRAPSWSPDGRWIVYAYIPTPGEFELGLVRADGSQPRRLTFNPKTDYDPDWGPAPR